ncbi:MAG: hypothetical protein L6Q98_08700 [Anaerolineae bacterium]|nr:hypothetical protein [Anaerolineae bacterium]NUQ05022.1 hypothetical protein [Anaerolineae bacterium]
MSGEQALDIQIKPLRTMEEMMPAVELQHSYWGEDAEAVIPAHMLFSLANFGGHVLAAYDGNRMVGVLVGFLGTDMTDPDRPAMANLEIVSKRMVILDSYRSHGIGYRLKLAQRDIALRQGVRLVVWTFDPLLAKNAHFNVRKLGAVCTAFKRDYYGTAAESGLARLGDSDRLFVEWWVTHRRVEEKLFGKRSGLTLPQYLQAETIIVNPTSVLDGLPVPSESGTLPATSLALVEIPTDYPTLEIGSPALAKVWRGHVRQWLELLFQRNYVVTDFLRTQHEGRDRAFYLLSYSGAQFETFSMN